jgi:Tol biopolymer transport system component
MAIQSGGHEHWLPLIARAAMTGLSLFIGMAIFALAAGRFLPHGAQIAFVSGRDDMRSDIYLMEVDRGLALNLTHQLTTTSARYWSPAWSPDGRSIAFTSNYQGGLRIFVMDAETTEVRSLLRDDGLLSPYWQPIWSPDNRQVAFKSYTGWVDNAEIFVTGTAGSEPFQLSYHGVVSFAWSPDSHQIAFATGAAVPNYRWKIYLIDVQQGRIVQQLAAPIDLGSAIAWSPDGQYLAFESTPTNNAEIFVVDVDSGRLHNLTENSANDGGPVWSPDGKQIAFYSDREGDLNIYVMEVGANPDKSESRRLTDTPFDDWGPVWSPDGSRIAFVADPGGLSEIYVMGADGGQLRALTANDVDNWLPVWRP